MDNFEAIVIGAAAAAIGTVLAYKFINRHPVGGAAPRQPAIASFNARAGTIYVVDPEGNPGYAAPVQQVSPNQEAAFNQQPTIYAAAFGPDENQPATEEVLPI